MLCSEEPQRQAMFRPPRLSCSKRCQPQDPWSQPVTRLGDGPCCPSASEVFGSWFSGVTRLPPSFLPSSPTSGLPDQPHSGENHLECKRTKDCAPGVCLPEPHTHTPLPLIRAPALFLHHYCFRVLMSLLCPAHHFRLSPITCLPKPVPPTRPLPELEDSNLPLCLHLSRPVQICLCSTGAQELGAFLLGPDSGIVIPQ